MLDNIRRGSNTIIHQVFTITLRIPNDIFSQVLSYATSKTKGNRSEAIVELIELGLAVASRQQSTQPDMTVQDSVILGELSQTVTGLTEQVTQLTGVVQDTVLQRMTSLETELMGGAQRLRADNEALRQQLATASSQAPTTSHLPLEQARGRVKRAMKLGDASQGILAVDSFIKELRLADYLNQPTQALPL